MFTNYHLNKKNRFERFHNEFKELNITRDFVITLQSLKIGLMINFQMKVKELLEL